MGYNYLDLNVDRGSFLLNQPQGYVLSLMQQAVEGKGQVGQLRKGAWQGLVKVIQGDAHQGVQRCLNGRE